MGMVSDGLPNGQKDVPQKILFDRLGADMASAACCRCRDAEPCTAAASATGALLAPTAPRRAARLRYVPRAQLRRGGWWYRGLKGEQGASEAGSSRIWRLILKLIAAVCRFDGGCVKRRLFRRPLTSCGPGATTAEVRGSGIGAVSPSAFGTISSYLY